MIKYRLVCKATHEFEGWFKNSAAFDSQSALKQVACPSCGSTDVTKAVMAPAVSTRSANATPDRVADDKGPATATHAYVPFSVVDIVRRLRAEIEKKAEYVGPRFAEEARRIHYEECPERGIYGEATADQIAELDAEGIEVFPIPSLPEKHN